MPTLQFKFCPRPFALLLALLQFAAMARAEVKVEVHGVADDVRANILAYLSFERYKNSDDLSPEFVERLQERAEREVRAAMRPFGFYEPAVTSGVRREGDKDYRVDINVTPNDAIKVSAVEVNVTGAGADDPIFTNITRNLPIRVDDRLVHSNYESLKGGLLRNAATYGYLDSRMTRNEMRVDPQTRLAQIYIDFETGERYKFGETTIQQQAVDEKLIRKFVRYQPGQPFDASKLLLTQFALDDSQYFSTVEVLPEDRDRETRTVPVAISAEANRRNRYQYGVGYGTDTEVRGTVSWENRLVNRHGHRFRVEVKGAALEQSVDARYIVPIGDPAIEKFQLQLLGTSERLADTDNRSINFIPSYTHVRGPWFGQYWQRVTYVELLQTESELVASGQRDKQTLLIPGMSFALVPPNYLGEAIFSRGLYGEVRGSNNALGSDADFLQVRLQAERVIPLAPKWNLLLRGDLGATALSKSSDLAITQRFFAGGDRSVRGFGKDDLSPVAFVYNRFTGAQEFNDDGTPRLQKVGGKHMFTGSVELVRDLPWKNLSVAVFGDVGNAFDNFGDPLMYSAGVGVRLRLPVVSVGIDVAQALTTPAGDTSRPGPRLHLNFSPKL